MSIDKNTNNEIAIPQVNTEHLLTGLYNHGEKQVLAATDNASAVELLRKNELLIAEVNAHADRIAKAAVATLTGMPADYHEAFFAGISCFNSPDDVIYNSIRQQWTG